MIPFHHPSQEFYLFLSQFNAQCMLNFQHLRSSEQRQNNGEKEWSCPKRGDSTKLGRGPFGIFWWLISRVKYKRERHTHLCSTPCSLDNNLLIPGRQSHKSRKGTVQMEPPSAPRGPYMSCSSPGSRVPPRRTWPAAEGPPIRPTRPAPAQPGHSQVSSLRASCLTSSVHKSLCTESTSSRWEKSFFPLVAQAGENYSHKWS